MALVEINKPFEPKVHVVGSETTPGKKYFVTHYRPHRWTCDCPNWVYRSHDDKGYSKNMHCKHIKLVMEDEGDIFVQTIALSKKEEE